MYKKPLRISAIFAFVIILSLTTGWISVPARPLENNPAPAPAGGRNTAPDGVTQLFYEGFESGTLGQFSSTYSICSQPGTCFWAGVIPGNSGMFSIASDVKNDISDVQLTQSIPVSIPANATAARLNFWHSYLFMTYLDGGVLESSINGGETWTDMQPYILSGGYDGLLSSAHGNPLGGQMAWTGSYPMGYFTEVAVDLLNFTGRDLLIRFRIGSDSQANMQFSFWMIDDVVITVATASNCPTPTWDVAAPYPIPIMDQATVSFGGSLYSFGGISNGMILPNAYRYDPLLNSWELIAPLPEARQAASAVTAGSYIYILGGWDASTNPTSTTYRYDPSSDTYTALPAYNIPTGGQAAVYLNYTQPYLYRIGGCTSYDCQQTTNTVEKLWLASIPSWEGSPGLPEAAGRLQAVAEGGEMYVAGGTNAGNSLQKTYVYNNEDSSWDDAGVPDLPAGRWGGASGWLNGRWVIAGGMLNSEVTSSVIFWPKGYSAWQQGTMPGLIQPRALTGNAVLGKAMYVVGGQDPGGGFSGTTNHQRYLDVPCSPCQGTNWTLASVAPEGIAHYAFEQLGDQFYIFGGGKGLGTPTNAVRRYNAVTNTWSDLPPIYINGNEVPVYGNAAAYSAGKFYVTQGYDGPGFYIFDLINEYWSAADNPVRISSYGAAMGAYYSHIYLVGGQDSPYRIDVYDIGTESWLEPASLPFPYFMGGYTQVGNYLYLVGGYDPTLPLDETTGKPLNLLNSQNLSAAAPYANSTKTMRLDLSNGTLSVGPYWEGQHANFALASDGEKLYAIGGDETGGTYNDYSNEVFEYSLADWPGGGWITSPPYLPIQVMGNQAGFFTTGCSGGTIWSVGGRGYSYYMLPHVMTRLLDPQCHAGLCPSPATFSGSLGPGDKLATQRLNLDGSPGSCGSQGSCSATSSAGHYYEEYPYVNNTFIPQCVTITANTYCTDENQIYVASYADHFDPDNACHNWIEDIGVIPSLTASYSNVVNPGQKLVVVVEQVNPGTVCWEYSVTLAADRCAGLPKIFMPVLLK